MNKYIVASGWDGSPDIVYAPCIEVAQQKAVAFSLAKGLTHEDANDPDISWAREFDPWLAKELGLIWLDEAETGWYEAEARP